MSKWNKILVASVASGAILTGVGAGAAQAAPRHLQSTVAVTSTSVAPAPPAPVTGGQADRLATAPAPISTHAPAAEAGVPIAVRLAVRAAMAVIKSRSLSTYNSIISYVYRGRVAFVNWWNSSVPTWVKGLMGGVSASAIYDAVRWIIGI